MIKNPKIVFLIQSHRDPEQVRRLAFVLKNTSKLPDNTTILISHDSKQPPLSQSIVAGMGHSAYLLRAPGARGDGSLIDSYLSALKWLDDYHIEYDWIVNLSGQDYPVKPVSALESMLSQTTFDGFMEYFPILSCDSSNKWGQKVGVNQYLYQYKRLATQPLPQWQRATLKIPRIVINNIQPWFRINTSYGLLLGKKVNSTDSPFTPEGGCIECYAGSYFMCLSYRAAQHLLNTSVYLSGGWSEGTTLLNYYHHTINAEESYFHTVLLDSEFFQFSNSNLHYINWKDSKHGHPKWLDSSDLQHMVDDKSNYFFARKFSMGARVLKELDYYLTAAN